MKYDIIFISVARYRRPVFNPLQKEAVTVSHALSVVSQSGRLCQALRGRVNELEAELAEQSHLKQQALSECEFLRVELDDLRRVREDTEKEQRSVTEIESKKTQKHEPAVPGTMLKNFHTVTNVSLCPVPHPPRARREVPG